MKKLKAFIKKHKLLYKFAWAFKNKPVGNSLNKKINGYNNQLNIASLAKLTNCTININGDNNTIEIGQLSAFNNVTFFLRGNNCKITIHEGVNIIRGGELWIEDNNVQIEIGQNCMIEQAHIAATEDHSKITIGAGCLFAYDIDIRSGDSHSIIDVTSNERLNFAKDVKIGNHVWIAAHCTILKGVSIADNCIVATRSVVTKSIDKAGVIIGGNPAKIIKENINWKTERIPRLK